MEGTVMAIRLIKEFKLHPNFEDDQGNTALHMACKCRLNLKTLELVKYLISDSNCDPFTTKDHGHMSLDIAIIDKNRELVCHLVNECGCGKLCK